MKDDVMKARISKELKEAAMAKAKAEARTLSGVLRQLLRAWLKP